MFALGYSRLNSLATCSSMWLGTTMASCSVFRMMADYEIVGEDDVPAFCERVRCLLPEHGHLPVTKEVQRMAVQSFAKRVSMWRPDNAPVTGSRFQDYLNIALMMGRMLGGEEA